MLNNKPDLTDEQKQVSLMQIIETDRQEIDDCLKALGMSKDKWDKMWGNAKDKQ